jgi:DNA-binding transcriptional ArsR family regulator
MSVEVLEPRQLSLSELADEANREHGHVVEAGAAMVEHAIRAGEALLAAQQQCEPKQWTAWLTEHWAAARVTALIYMRLARHQDEIRAQGFTSVITARRHLTMIQAPGAPSKHGWKNPPTWVTDEAHKLRAEGLSYAEISRRLEVPWATIRYWLDPELTEKARLAAKKRRAERRAEREREKQREIKRAARRAGSGLAEAYAMAERMQDVIGRAHAEATDREVRASLARAGEHYRRMRDDIVRALGVAA